ncbi:ABC transporter substrate-binding protein [Planobispora takensis]|nr:ABC transporter substrate-binding protein [Planobispora takensis]
MRKYASTVTAALVLALSGCAGAQGGPESGTSGAPTTLNIATLTKTTSMDPATAVGSGLPFFQPVYDTLIKREPDGSYSPMLATEWAYDDSNTELALTLRGGVTFQDGTAFDAAAVKANLDRFKKAGGPDAANLAGLKSVEVVDATHVKLTLERPDPGLLFYLSDSAGLMASPAAFAKADELKTKPNGTGPYRLDGAKTVIGTKWVYTRRSDYWGAKLPYDTITMSVFDNETAIVNGIKTGQIDTAVLQDVGQQAGIKSDPGVTVADYPFDFQGLLLFDRGGKVTPALREAKVRQALNHALDRETMLSAIRQGRGEITAQVFGPSSTGYVKELDGRYPYDPAKAKALLQEAGYGDGFTMHLPRITAIVNDALAASMQTDLGKVGVKLVWDQADTSVMKKIFIDREYSGMVMNIGQSSNDWIVVRTLVLPGTFNMFGTTDETVGKLVAEIQGKSAEAAKADFQELNTHLVEEGWFVPFFRMTNLLVSDKDVKAVPQAGMAVPSIYNYAPA